MMKKRIWQHGKRVIKRLLLSMGVWERVKRWRGHDKPGLHIETLAKSGIEFYHQFVKPGALVFDVGANYGNRVGLFLECGARVIAVEPQSKCGRYLEETYGNRITWLQKGIGSVNEWRDFYEADNSVLSTFSSEYIDRVKDTRHQSSLWQKSATRIEIITLDQLVESHGVPDFVKVDVEGFEREVVGGLSKAYGVLSLEYTVPELSDDLLYIVNRLEEIGYTAFNHSIGESMKLAGPWVTPADFIARIKGKDFVGTRFGDIYAKIS